MDVNYNHFSWASSASSLFGFFFVCLFVLIQICHVYMSCFVEVPKEPEYSNIRKS